jgi:eukaryotic-like serine/threonine-protein kinase
VTGSPAALTAALADRYRIERELGAGGMATVYLAEDLRHKRRVAVKVLRPELAAVIGAERFLAEITTTANLQHPHILPLHDSGTVNGSVFYVMPYVEGESLRDRLAREKQLPLADAVRIAREIASALDYAHRHGVIHRDIKPENILLHDGQALVADFGIALAASRTEGGSRMTETGMSLGTPHYMSPEQAMGERNLDGRTDIYALGCVLHEMLAGEPPFTGPTAQAIVAKVMGSEPEPLTALRRTVPPYVEDAVLTALAKLPADRFASAGAFAAALEGTGDPLAGRTRQGRSAAAPLRRRRAALQAGVFVVLGAVALWGWLRPTAGGPGLPPTQLALLLPDFGGAYTGLRRQLAITPDGTALIYTSVQNGQSTAMRIGLDGSPARPISGVLPFLADYTISTDGREFIAADRQTEEIYRYPISGGTGTPLPRGVTWAGRGAWASDGSLWITNTSALDVGIARVGPGDSVTHPLGGRNADLAINQVLPGDRMALMVRQPVGTASGPALLLDLKTGEASVLIDAAIVEIRYAAGYLVYVLTNGNLEALRFDLGRLRVIGAPVSLASGVTLTGTGLAQFAVADNGTVAFVVEAGRSLVLADRSGATRVVVEEMQNYHHPRFSPDGRRLAVDFNSAVGRDVWIANLADGALTRATFDRDGHDASWSPDGRELAYTSFRHGDLGIYQTRPGSAEPAESLLTSKDLAYTGIWFRDKSALLTVGVALRPESGLDIGILRNGGRGPLEPLIATRFAEQYPALSPDNQWIAFASNLSGRDEVYLQRLTGGDEQVQVSLDGGTEPVWSPDGRELFYRSGAGPGGQGGPMITAALLTTRPTLAVVSRKPLFSAADIVTANPHGNFDISPDGRTFAFVRSNPSSRVMVIQNLPAFVALRSSGEGATR